MFELLRKTKKDMQKVEMKRIENGWRRDRKRKRESNGRIFKLVFGKFAETVARFFFK